MVHLGDLAPMAARVGSGKLTTASGWSPRSGADALSSNRPTRGISTFEPVLPTGYSNYPIANVGLSNCASTRIRPSRTRDLDDDGRRLLVASEGGKTAAAERQREIPDELRPHLKRIVQDRWLFDFEPDRKRRTTNLYKSRRDALLRRVRSLCKAAGVPEVVSHSMRGLHAKLATERGVTSHAVAAALGHTSFVVTAQHDVGAAVTRGSDTRRTLRVLGGTGEAVARAASEFTAGKKASGGPRGRGRQVQLD